MPSETQPPPQTIQANQPFSMALRLNNAGTTDINDSTGLLHAELNTQNLYYLRSRGETEPEQTLALKGKSNVRPSGEEASVFFGRYQLANQSRIGNLQEATETAQARICYPYQTDFSTTICVENPFNTAQNNPLCDPRNASTYGGSGAPVTVSKVQNRMIPVGQATEVIERQSLTFFDDRISGVETVEEEERRVIQQPVIQLTLRNAGDGRPALNDDLCQADTRQPNTVHVDASLGNSSLTCEPQEVDLGGDGVGTTRCHDQDERLTINSNYQSILSVNLDYNYVTTTTKDINIVPRQGFNR